MVYTGVCADSPNSTMTKHLSERARQVLETAVRCYIETGAPVSSRMIARRLPARVSAATVRNEMMDLADEGYLEQPHTSAGRVPTNEALRVYVESLGGIEVSPRWRAQIELQYADAAGGFADIAQATSKALASVSNNAGLVMFVSPHKWALKHVEFVKVGPSLILAVLASPMGLCRTHVFSWDEDISARDLEQVNNYINTHFEGQTLEAVIQALSNQVEREQVVYQTLVGRALALGLRALAATEQDDADIVVEGAERVLEHPDFANVDKIKALFRAFEEKKVLIRLLSKALSREGATVYIGQELDEEAQDLALVAAPYHGAEVESLGTLGILGPTRMDYGEVIPLVEYTARLVSTKLANAG